MSKSGFRDSDEFEIPFGAVSSKSTSRSASAKGKAQEQTVKMLNIAALPATPNESMKITAALIGLLAKHAKSHFHVVPGGLS